MAVNLRHLFFAAQAVVPAMKRAGGGVILNFGSISWHLALPDLVLYQTAKAGIEGLTRSLARDLGRDNIRSEEHTSELQSLMRISYAVFCLKKKNNHNHVTRQDNNTEHIVITHTTTNNT